jgi:hypothetical protein
MGLCLGWHNQSVKKRPKSESRRQRASMRHVKLRSKLSIDYSRHVDACKEPWLKIPENVVPVQHRKRYIKKFWTPRGGLLQLISLLSRERGRVWTQNYPDGDIAAAPSRRSNFNQHAGATDKIYPRPPHERLTLIRSTRLSIIAD